MKSPFFASTLFSWVFTLATVPVVAQPIIPTADGTGTNITVNGNEITIDGGTFSVDGRNLFHSFQEFGLDTNQIANFLSNPDIRNILGRIVGGNASVIDGLIQVTGGSSNLFLMNPAGFIFGENASLNVLGDFTATTATGIGFGENLWFDFDTKNYQTLIGNPSLFQFDLDNSGTIINEGNLAVDSGNNLVLTGGSFTNSGTIAAPNGNIIVTAIEGTNRVRIVQEGSLLSLEITLPDDGEVSALDLPGLLTGAPGYSVNEGEISGENVQVEARTLINQGIVSGQNIDAGFKYFVNSGEVRADGGGSIDIEASERILQTDAGSISATEGGEILLNGGSYIISGTLDASNSQGVGGTIHILGDYPGLAGATVNASGKLGGGEVLIGGDYQGLGDIPTAETTRVYNTDIFADAIESGDGGRVILWADNQTQFSGNISVRGGTLGGDGGFVEVSGKQGGNFAGFVDAGAIAGEPGTLLLDPKNITIADGGSTADPNNLFNETPAGDFTFDADYITTITNTGTAVILQANNDLTVNEAITTNNASGVGGNITFQAGRSILVNANITTDDGALTLSANDPGADAGNRDAGAGSLTLAPGVAINTGAGNFTATLGNGESGGILFNVGSNVTTTTGNITLNANLAGTATGTFNGIELDDADLSTTTGTITLNGTGGPGTDNNYGVFLQNSATITSVEGAINITGQGNGTGNNNYGIYLLNGSQISSTGTGADAATITLDGTGGTGTDQNYGVFLEDSVTITSADGAIDITGQGGNGTGNNNYGIYLLDSSQITSTGTGTNAATITLNGTGGTGTALNYGVLLNNSGTITSVDGAIDITGLGGNGTGASNYGIYLLSSSQITSTGTGTNAATITLNGTGGTGTNTNDGINIGSTGTTISSVDGAISLTGNGGGNASGSNNLGIRLAEGLIQSTGTGVNAATLNFTGFGGSGTLNNFGLQVTNDGRINSQEGAITLIGTGGDGGSGVGVNIDSGGDVVSTGTGTNAANIIITGTGGTGNLGSNSGVSIQSNDLSTVGGNMIITGTGTGTGGNDHGVLINSGTLTSTGIGSITLAGTGASSAGSRGILHSSGTITSSGTGDLTFQTGDLEITDASQVQGSASLFIEPFNTTDNFTFSNTSAAPFIFSGGFSDIFIGSASGSGNVTFSAGSGVTFNDPVTLRSPIATGSVNTTGQPLTAPQLTINTGGTTTLGSTTVSGNLDITSGGAINDDGINAITVTGTITLDSGSSDIFLDNNNHNFATLSITNSNNVIINDLLTLNLATVNVGGTFALTSAGDITDTGNSTIVGNTTITSTLGNITLDSAGNSFGNLFLNGSNVTVNENNDMVLGASIIGNNLSLTAPGNMTQISPITVGGIVTLNAGSNDITLTNTGNQFGTLQLIGNNVAIAENGATDLGLSTIAGNFSVTTTGLLSDSAPLTVTGNSTFTTSLPTTGQVSFVNSNPAGTVLDTTTVGGDLTITSPGTVSQLGDVRVARSLTILNASDVTLNNPGNIFPTLNLPNGDVIINQVGAIISSVDATVTGDLTVNSLASGDQFINNYQGSAINLNDGGNSFGGSVSLTTDATGVTTVTETPGITQLGILTVTGTTVLNATATGDITLPDVNNQLGEVQIVGNNVTLTELDGVNLGLSNITGDLTLTGAGGISQTGTLTVGGNATLSGGINDITLTNAGNQFNNLGFTGNNVSITDSDGINLLTSSPTGTFTLISGGVITQTGTLSVGQTATFNSGSNNISLTDINNQLGTVQLTGNNVSLTDIGGIDLGTSNLAGTLTLSTTGNIIQSGDITVAGTTTLNSGLGDIILDSSGNTFGTLTLNGNNITLNENEATELGLSAIAGTLSLTSTGSISQTNSVSVGGIVTLDAGTNNITLTDINNQFGTLQLTGNNVAITENDVNTDVGLSNIVGNFNLTSTGTITDSGTLTVGGNSAFTTSLLTTGNTSLVNINPIGTLLDTTTIGGDLTLTSTGNVNQLGDVRVAGSVTFNAPDVNLNNPGNILPALTSLNGDVVVTQVGGINVVGQNVTGDLTVNSLAVGDQFTGVFGGNAIVLDDASNAFGGSVRLTTDAPGVTTTTGIPGITQLGPLNVTGTTIFNATATGDITLPDVNNRLGEVQLFGRTVILNELDGITLRPSNIAETLTLVSGGVITQTGPLTVGGNATFNSGINDITLIDLNNQFNNLGFTGNNVSIIESNGVNLLPSTATGNFTLSSDGAITQMGTLIVGGSATFNSGINDITLTDINNQFGTLQLTGNNVAIAESDLNTDLGLSNITGTFDLTSTGTITDSGTLTVGGNSTFTTSLPTTGNTFLVNLNPTGIVLDTTTIGGDFILTSTGDVTQLGDIKVAGNATLNVPSFTLNNPGNILPSLTSLNGDVVITQVGGINVPGQTVTGNLTVNSLTTGEQFTGVFGGNAITLDDASNTFGGSVSLTTDAPATTTVTTATSGITQLGALTVAGTTILNATPTGDIFLADINNQFGEVQIVGRNVTLTENEGINLGLSTITGDLSVTANGNIIQSGDLIVAGNTTLNGGNNDILLTGNNDFNLLNVPQANQLNLNDINDLTLGLLTLNGDLTLTAATLSTTTEMTIPGAINFNAPKLNLNNNLTSLTSTLTLAGDVTIGNPIILGTTNQDITVTGLIDSAIDTSNDLTFTSGSGNVTLNQGVGTLTSVERFAIITANTVATATINANQIDITASNQITSSGTYTTAGGTLNLTAQNQITLGDLNTSSPTTPGGIITVTSTNDQIITANLNSSGTTGGTIFINALQAITLGSLNSSGSNGNGGNITLDPIGDVEVVSIDAQGGVNGIGGNVDITAGQNFRATGTFTDQNGILSSISTTGGQGNGNIIIRHGGNGETAFEVGNAITNGSAAAITSGDFTLLADQSLLFDTITGNIQILSGVTEPLTVAVTSAVNPPDLVQIQESQDNNPATIAISVPNVTTTVVTESVQVEQVEVGFSSDFTSYFEGDVGTTDIASSSSSSTSEGDSSSPSISSGETSNSSRQNASITVAQMGSTLQNIVQATGVKPALIYVTFISPGLASQASILRLEPQLTDELQLYLVTESGQLISYRIDGVTRRDVLETAQNFRKSVGTRQDNYRESGQQLYQWLIAPLEDTLKAEGIENLAFSLDAGLRSIPLAAIYDGERHIVERYSIGLMPSISLTDTRYVNIQELDVLAMGASEFADEELGDLPGAEAEIQIITKQVWGGEYFLNDDFSADTLRQIRSNQPFGIVHLATHGKFRRGEPSNSYIQFGDQKLGLDQIRQLGLNDPPVELMVLSACQTAVGDPDAELGFAGLAVQAGVKTALGSLWTVSDAGTMGLMTMFYQQLRQVPIKAEALRQAQLSMLEGEVRIENGQVVTNIGTVELPPEVANLENTNLTHPYFWSGFTMIGNPW